MSVVWVICTSVAIVVGSLYFTIRLACVLSRPRPNVFQGGK